MGVNVQIPRSTSCLHRGTLADFLENILSFKGQNTTHQN